MGEPWRGSRSPSPKTDRTSSGQGRWMRAGDMAGASMSSPDDPLRRAQLPRGYQLDGRRAVITGASSGIGLATARALRQAGASVAAGARRTERLEGDFVQRLD